MNTATKFNVVYDIETLPHFFSYTAKCVDTGTIWQFQISPLKSQKTELIAHLRTLKGMIGYNNVGFDSYIIDWILRNRSKPFTYFDLYNQASALINRQDDDFKPNNTKPLIPQLDVYRLSGFHKPVKATSLKWCQFGMDFENVEDVDFKELSHILSPEEEKKVLLYNLNDVLSTEVFYNKSKKLIEVRKELSKLYGINLMNADEPKLTMELFLELFHRESGIPKDVIKQGRTPRNIIELKELILPYVKFDTPELQDALKLFQDKIIVGGTLKGALEYNTRVFGIDVFFGLGGIHACIEPGVYSSDEEYVIMDADVTSFYPMLAIRNKWSPEHLDTESFVRLYEGFFNERQHYAKDHPVNYMYKILLNGTFGKSNEESSFLYDPAYTCKTTMNGQLLLSMLGESLMNIPNLQFLQWNTDGLTARFPKKYMDLYNHICKEWEKMTKLSLEFAEYNKMIIRDVNNYISVTSTGKVKSKGLFEYKDLPFNKNKSYAIIPIALEAYFLKAVPIETTIKKHTNIFDFFKGIKSKFNSYYVFVDSKGKYKKLQKVNRYFICTPQSGNKGRILKKYTDGRSAFTEAGSYYQQVVNKIDKSENYLKEINYSYYIKETNKWLDVIENKKLTLF